MKRIAFVVPWVGRLPVYFPLWLNTCLYNSTVDFIVVTSEKQLGDLPENVRWINMSFKEIQNRFQALFDFPIALQKPYKLCDFKPVYGQAFAPELKGYDFWGYCDVDLLWGDISRFITDELLEQYDRLYTRGHCCIYRNCERVNAWYRELPHEGLQNWESVFSSPKSFCFDEWHQGGLSEIIKANQCSYYDSLDMADLDISKGFFSPHRIPDFQKGDAYFEYEKGKLWMSIPDGKRQEVLYCHFQKRKIEIDPAYDKEHFYFCAPGMVTSDFSKVKQYRMKELKFELSYLYNRIIRKMKKLITGEGVI